EIDRLVIGDWRRNDSVTSRKFPLDTVELARSGTGINAGMRRVAPEHRLGLRCGGNIGGAKQGPRENLIFLHCDLRKSSGNSIGPCKKVPLISLAFLSKRPS